MSCSNHYEFQTEVTVIRGDTWQGIRFTVSRAGADYTTATVKWQLRAAADGTVLISKNITPESAAEGQIVFRVDLTSVETTKLNQSVVQSDVQITIPGDDDDVRTPIAIKLLVPKDITK